MWDNLVIFKERLENEDAFMSQEIYIFFKRFTYFLGHEAASAPLPNFHHPHNIWTGRFYRNCDTWDISESLFVKKYLLFKPLTPTTPVSLRFINPTSIGFNILYLISISGLCSGVSYQIELLPTQTNLICCAHRLIQHSAVTADWVVDVSCTVNLINNLHFYYTQTWESDSQKSWDGKNSGF